MVVGLVRLICALHRLAYHLGVMAQQKRLCSCASLFLRLRTSWCFLHGDVSSGTSVSLVCLFMAVRSGIHCDRRVHIVLIVSGDWRLSAHQTRTVAGTVDMFLKSQYDEDTSVIVYEIK